MENIDTLIISLVIATGCAIIENIYGWFFKKPPAFCTGNSCTSLNLKKESFENSENSENSSMNTDNSTVNTDNSTVNTDNSTVNTVYTVDNSTMNTASSEESHDSAVASIISTAESKPTKITIESNNGVATTYTQTASGTYVKTSGTVSTPSTTGITSTPSTASTTGITNTPSTASTASTTGITSTASTTGITSTASTASTTGITSSDADYISTIDIAGVTGENVMDYGAGNDFNRLPVSTLEYDYGYSFMPPKDWFPIPPNPPVCMSEKKCPVCPIYTDGTLIDLKEWNKSLKVA